MTGLEELFRQWLRAQGLEWMTPMVDAIPPDQLQGIVKDNLGPSGPRSMLGDDGPKPKEQVRGEAPLLKQERPQSEVELIDRIVERFAGGPNNVKPW